MKRFAYIVFISLLCACSPERLAPSSADWSLSASILDVQGLGQTKVSYGGDYGEHSEFEVGDVFGLFVLDTYNTLKFNNLQVYCSGFDNKGGSVWSIFKEVPGDNTSNYPLSEILSEGKGYFAYYPYDKNLTVSNLAGLKSMISNAYASLPSDQSTEYTGLDLLVASNVEGCKFGEVTVSGKSVSLEFGHVMAMLRYFIPSGSVKYEYSFSGDDFTPHLMGTADGKDEFRFLFKPGCVLDVCVKFVKDKKLYKFETGNSKNIFPINTEAGHCYFLDEHAPKVPYSTAVDMGTSVMWASFNLGAEDNEAATADNISGLAGHCFMWGVNQTTSSFGNSSYTNYNNSFTAGTKPKDLPAGYDYSGDVIYDAARNIWGGEWRTPTWAEWQELFDACTYQVETKKITLTSKKTGNTLVFPYQGYNNGTTVTQPEVGYYWSSTSNPDNIAKAYSTLFRNYNSAPGQNANADRYTGLPVRAVYSRD